MCSAAYCDDDKAHQDGVMPLVVTLLGDRDLVGLRNSDGTFVNRVITYSPVQTGTQVHLLLCEWKDEIGGRDTDVPTELDYCIASVDHTSYLVVPFERSRRSQGPSQRFNGNPGARRDFPTWISSSSPKLDFSLTSPPSPTKAPKTRLTSVTKDTGSDPNGNRAAFIANTEDNQKAVVKFTEVYNRTAHCLPTARVSRPCDRSISSDLTMVVMDHAHEYPYMTPDKVLNKVSEASKVLHISTTFNWWISIDVEGQEKGSIRRASI
ncbi:hypothetical protein BDM02DRAFT_3264192 [Thelephora ganbajun]|uniref:Uncharacterized protein n=1 Tax=Thelephora ganbajun TaxID=370292 RepID=A0ACB6Z126_THEGA|nr:hypothetical protein BDM02DRAFT_3264192 [Thelephora ganbajun]